jgi:hypothetical protein
MVVAWPFGVGENVEISLLGAVVGASVGKRLGDSEGLLKIF